MLVTFNFGLQLLIDLCSVWFVDEIGYRVSMVLALVWAYVPVINGIVFLKVPIAPLLAAGEEGLSVKELFKSGLFWQALYSQCFYWQHCG